jgi:hypothetical protein
VVINFIPVIDQLHRALTRYKATNSLGKVDMGLHECIYDWRPSEEKIIKPGRGTEKAWLYEDKYMTMSQRQVDNMVVCCVREIVCACALSIIQSRISLPRLCTKQLATISRRYATDVPNRNGMHFNVKLSHRDDSSTYRKQLSCYSLSPSDTCRLSLFLVAYCIIQ